MNLFVTNEHDENLDVVRVDTAHDGCHVDRLHLPEEHPKRRDYSLTFCSPEAVFEWMTAGGRWQSFLDAYEANHGLPATARDRLG